VFEVRDLWPELPKAMGVIRNPVVLGLMSMLESVTYHSAGRLIGLSPGIVDGIARRGIPRQAITMIPNGCNFDIFSQSGAQWQPDGVKEGDLLAVFAGTHGIANGLESVLDAATELGRRGRNDIKLLLIGQGRLKSALVARASAERLDNVLFHAPVDKARLSALMARADIGMQILANVPAFYYGTSPNKFFDYLAAGKPVLTNYPGWVAELIRESHCGYAVPPENPVAFAEALEHAADNRDQIIEMGARARQLGRRIFDRTQLASQFAEWLEGAAAK
jgi:glycosyltransferase involved in cell wall biosynthesis